MTADIKWEGLDEFQAFLRKTPGIVRRDMEAALFQEGENIMGDSKDRTPVDLGFLKAGGHSDTEGDIPPPWVELSKKGRKTIEVVLAYAASYAVFAHEQEPREGGAGESKFLENAMKKAARGFGRRMITKTLRSLKERL